MRIGIIARGLTRGGVSRYIRNILKEFDVGDFPHEFFLFTDEPNQSETYNNIKVQYIKKSNKLFWDYISVLPKLKKERLDVIFYPKNIIPITHHLFLKSKKVNVIHDLAYFDKKLNEYKFFDTMYMKMFMGLSCRIADGVVAVSQNTKNDLISILKVPSEKIVVIYEGIEKKFRRQTDTIILEKTLQKFKIHRPFIFYCGSLSPRKNMLRVLRAFNDIKEQIPHNAYLAGGQSWHDEDVLKYIKENLSGRVFQIGYVSDEELINLYSSADLFLYPSLYEGFGLPILEAQACGCPVLTSNINPMKEVAANGTEYVDPYNQQEITDAIVKLSLDKKLQHRLIQKGLINAEKYKWKTTVNDLLDNINKLS